MHRQSSLSFIVLVVNEVRGRLKRGGERGGGVNNFSLRNRGLFEMGG